MDKFLNVKMELDRTDSAKHIVNQRKSESKWSEFGLVKELHIDPGTEPMFQLIHISNNSSFWWNQIYLLHTYFTTFGVPYAPPFK